MDLSKFKPSDWLKVGGGALFFIAGFLNWWEVDLPAGLGSVGANGWDYFWTTGIAWLLLVGVATVTIMQVLGKKLPLDLPWPLVVLGETALALLLVIIRFFSDGTGVDNTGLSRGIGAYLGIIAAIAAVVGAVMGFKESGGDLTALKDMNKLKAEFNFNKGGSGTLPPPASPPPPPPPAPPTPQ